MFSALGRMAARRRRLILVLTLVFVAGGGAWGFGVFGALTGGATFDNPNSENQRASALLQNAIGRQGADIIVLYESPNMTVDDPGFAGPVRSTLASIPSGDVTSITSYYSTRQAAFVSTDRHATYVAVQLPGSDDNARSKEFVALQGKFQVPGLTVHFGGSSPTSQEINSQVARDLARAELLSWPVLLVLLVLIFGSAVAACLPLLVGGVVIIGAFALLRLFTLFTEVSTFALNIVTMLSLGLAIDYALVLINRFREELAAGWDVDTAVTRTMTSAGRAVGFSALTVVTSLSLLTLFNSPFLRSMGYGGVAVTLFAVLTSLTLLPALLRMFGTRVNAARVPLPKLRRKPRAAGDQGGWYRLAHVVMRRPAIVTIGTVAVLVGLGLPFLGAHWSRPDTSVLPTSADARIVANELTDRFTVDPTKTVTAVVTLPADSGSATARTELTGYLNDLETVPGVTGGQVTATKGDVAAIVLRYSPDSQSQQARDMVAAIRAKAPPAGASMLLSGFSPSLVDMLHDITNRAPWVALFVVIVWFVVLFFAFGSVVLPLKSVVMNLLSLSASFGAIKLIFQDGHLSNLLGFTSTGTVDVNMPVLMIAITVGLIMDYEVFLVSRIREQYARTHDHRESIAVGLQRTGRIITSGALLMIIVVGGFATSGITFMKMIGVGMVIALVVDATIVRALLVPATMRLLGRAIWWAPGPLARWWSRFGFREDEAEPKVELSEPELAAVRSADEGALDAVES